MKVVASSCDDYLSAFLADKLWLRPLVRLDPHRLPLSLADPFGSAFDFGHHTLPPFSGKWPVFAYRPRPISGGKERRKPPI